MPYWSPEEAVALLLEIDPDSVGDPEFRDAVTFERSEKLILRANRAIEVKPDDFETRVARQLVALDGKADPGPVHRMIDEIRVQHPDALPRIADSWVLCALAERDPAALENALRALGNNTWGDNATLLSV